MKGCLQIERGMCRDELSLVLGSKLAKIKVVHSKSLYSTLGAVQPSSGLP